MGNNISKIMLPGGSTPYNVKDIYARQHIAYGTCLSESTSTAYKVYVDEYSKIDNINNFPGYENGMCIAVKFTVSNTDSSSGISIMLCNSDGTTIKDTQSTEVTSKYLYLDGTKVVTKNAVQANHTYFLIYNTTLGGWEMSQLDISGKVDKKEGWDLSENNFTDEEKALVDELKDLTVQQVLDELNKS